MNFPASAGFVHSNAHRQRGVALAVALIILVITTIIALSANRFTVLEVRQSSSFETVREAQEGAQSVVDAVAALSETLVVSGTVGDIVCTPTPGIPGTCTTSNLALANNLYATEIAAGKVWGKSERVAPLFRNLPRIRGSGSSAVEFKGATFNVQGSYDRTTDRMSRARVEQGYIVPFQAGGAQ